MRRGRLALALAALAAAAASPAAPAQESGVYLGLALGQSKFKEWCDTGGSTTASFNSCKDTDTAWKLLGGYRFNRYLALEASYIDWGEVTATVNVSGTLFEVAANQQSYSLAGVGSVQVGANFSVFAKAGFVKTDQETRRISPNPSTVKRDEEEFLYGFGARYQLAPQWALRAEWENTDKLKVEMLSIGAEYRF